MNEDDSCPLACMNNQKICPYCLKDLNTIPHNKEHVIPAALGGSDSFIVYASVDENSTLNKKIDSPFVNNEFVKLITSTTGARNRSGKDSIDICGTIPATGEKVLVKIDQNGITPRFYKNIELAGDGGIQIKGFTDLEIQRRLDEMKKSVKKDNLILRKQGKQKKIEITGHGEYPPPEIKMSFPVDLGIIKDELLKISYLSCVKTFGDSFIRSHSGMEINRLIHSENLEESKLKFNFSDNPFKDCISFKKEEHVVGIFYNSHNHTMYVFVNLFGVPFLTSLCIFEFNPPQDFVGVVYVNDSTRKKMQTFSIFDFFRKRYYRKS